MPTRPLIPWTPAPPTGLVAGSGHPEGTGPNGAFTDDDYRAAGLPRTWLIHATAWAQRDLTPSEIAPYATVHRGHALNPAYVADYALHGLDAPTAMAYSLAGASRAAIALAHLGCPPEVVATFRDALGAGRDHEGILVSLCTAADAATSRADLTHAFLSQTPAPTTAAFSGVAFIEALRTWAGPEAPRSLADLPAARIVALHHGGFTPADLAVNPDLATCPALTLRAMAALVSASGSGDHGPTR